MVLTWQIVKFQLKETFAIAYGNYAFREALIITLESHGEKGYGECTSIDYYQISFADFSAILEKMKHKIESQKIVHPTYFYAFLEQLNLPSFLRSALDCAFWDLFGKLEKRSFLDLNKIEVSNLPESSITISVDSVEKQIEKISKSSWTKFKVKCNGYDEKAVTKFANLDKNIALDSNGSFQKENCLWLENSKMTSKFLYLEQPMAMGFENFSVLHNDKFANWMADEDCQSIYDLEKLQLHYKSVNIKLVKCGGLTPALEMINEARKLNFQIMIGCMTESTVGISAGAVLAPLCDFADLDGANLIANDIAKGSFVENGKICLNDSYGLGIQLKC